MGERSAGYLLVPILVSKLGNQFLISAIPLVLYDLTGSATDAVLFFAVGTLPWLASAFIGAVIDRFDRRQVFLASECLQACAVAALALTISTAPLPLTYLLFLITSTGAVTSSIVVNFLLLPALAPTGRLARLNGLFIAAGQLVALLGLPLGGFVYGTLGARPVLLIDAASFALTVGAGLLLPSAAQGPADGKRSWPAIHQGWRYLLRQRELLRVALVLGVCNLGAGSLAVVILQLARRSWHWNTTAARHPATPVLDSQWSCWLLRGRSAGSGMRANGIDTMRASIPRTTSAACAARPPLANTSAAMVPSRVSWRPGRRVRRHLIAG